MEIIDVNQPKRVRQQISIPFIWESKPGTPKRDWISNPVSLISYPPPSPSPSPSPSKLVVSVPFEWEEEPGKPLTQSSCSWNPFLAGDDDDDDDYSIGFDLDNFNNPFVTGPTVPDIPFTEEKDEDEPNLFKQSMNGEAKDSNWQPNLNSLSESEEYSSSSQNSITTQNEASSNGFDMELLFALSSPEVSFLGNLFEKNGDDKRGPTGRRELTLGELIMLSRKLSYRNDSQDVHKKNPSKELMKKIRVTCF
ncbi:uncharacterized protein LOC144566739 [Carex rostrata]